MGAGTLVRANTLIDGQPLREGETVDVCFDPLGCVLLDAQGLRIA
ncbi:hypothetical protein NKH14_19115 [Mesorhizobium sp. M1380]